MFDFTTCSHPGCRSFVATGSDACYRHSKDPGAVRSEAERQLRSPRRLDDWCITGAEFGPFTLPEGKLLAGCDFAWCTFHQVDFSKTHCISSFFDFCLFDRCVFRGIDCRYSVLSGSKLIECDWSGSVIVHTNFIGIDAMETSFDSCDLYFSNFSSSFLRDTSFEDCNLRKADFRFSEQRRVSFRYSNSEDAMA